ncbi:hypothetical protein IC582_028433 [Cucumis melo]
MSRILLSFCHERARGEHFGLKRTAKKILDSGFYWKTFFIDSYAYCKTCEKCKKFGSISKRNEMPLKLVLLWEVFDIWEIDFLSPFPSSFGNLYILLTVNYVSKWVEAIPTRTNSSSVVSSFLVANIFSSFGTSKSMISDQRTHFCNRTIEAMMKKYVVQH